MAEIQTEVAEKKTEAPSFIEEVSSHPSVSIHTSPEADRMEGGQTKGVKKRGKKNGKVTSQQYKRQLRKMFEDFAHTCAKQAVAAAELIEKAPDVSAILKEIAHELALAASKLLVAAKTSTNGLSLSKLADGTEPIQNGSSLRFPGRYYQASSNLGGPPSPVASARSDSLFIDRRFKNPQGDRRRRRKGRQGEAQLGRDAPSVVPEPGEESPPSNEAENAAQGKRARVQQAPQEQPPPPPEGTTIVNGASDCPDSESG